LLNDRKRKTEKLIEEDQSALRIVRFHNRINFAGVVTFQLGIFPAI